MSATTIAFSTPVAQGGDAAGEYRYPGSPPFADTEISRLLFHGRTREIDQVLHSILSFDLFLVYAVSGVGKTSLLTAGVSEPLRERGYFPVMVRLNDPTRSPVELIDAQIRAAGANSDGITVMRHPAVDAGDISISTLWDLLATLEIWRGNELQRLVLVFDQFEELFTLGWSDEQRQRFIEDFGQVVRRTRPRTSEPDAGGLAALPPPDVKITLVVREDFLGELEALAAHVPQIMQHRFRLDGLQRDAALSAICAPAAVLDARLATARFTYSEGAAQTILDFLRARETPGRPVLTRSIDPCQLQIICQHVERSILPGKPATGADGMVEVTEADLGGRSGLERILRDFYRRELMSFPSGERKLVRRLCESGLINQSGRRLSLEEGEISDKFGVSRQTLDRLVSRRLLRAEPRVGSVYYELAHDSLAAPILAYRADERATRRRRRRRWIAVLAAVIATVAVAVAVAIAVRGTADDDDAGPAVATRLVSVGDEAAGTINVDAFEFDLERGERVAVEAAPIAGDELEIEVVYPSGMSEPAGDDEGEPAQVVLVGTEPGRYRVVVTGPSSGPFQLSVDPVDVPELVLGGEMAGSIATGGAAQTFVFEQSGDQAVNFVVAPDGDLDAKLELTDPTGATVSRDHAGKSALEAIAVTGSVQGSYRIVVRPFETTTGSFALTARPVEVVPLGVEQQVSGTVDGADDVTVMELLAPPGQSVLVEFHPSASLDAVLELTGPGGFPGMRDDGSDGVVEWIVVTGVPGGAPRIVVRGYGTTVGPFRLSTRPIVARELTVDATAAGSIDGGEPAAAFSLVVDEPATYAIEIEAEGDLKPDTVLVGADGEVYWIPPGQSGEIELEPGRYPIVVMGASATTGDFELSVQPKP